MKHRPDLQHVHEGETGPASRFAGGATAFDSSPRQQRQREQLAQLRGSGPPAAATGVAQAKGRVALDKIDDREQRERIEKEVQEARRSRIEAKQVARLAWQQHGDGSQDDAYNAAMEKARGDYGSKLWNLKERESLNAEQFVSGRAYYGAESNGVYTRPDNGKQYVEDANGVFIRRHVRRELNKFDLPKVRGNQGLASTGHHTHGFQAPPPVTTTVADGKAPVPKKKKRRAKPREPRYYGDKGKEGTELDDTDREFLQQSWGGGANQFAISHTATHYPILSNDHKNFGRPGKFDTPDDEHGRIVTDLSELPKNKRRAQWALDEDGRGKGHKIRRKQESFPEEWMKDRRDKVIMSGYRNMEVVTGDIPMSAIAKTQEGWEDDDSSGLGLSPAGQWFRDLSMELEKPHPTEEKKTEEDDDGEDF